MKKMITLALATIMAVMLTSCAEDDSYQDYSEATSESQEISKEESVSEPEDTPVFLQGLGTVKNQNGTFSFCGCVTAYQTSPYGGFTIYITALNGHEFSTGAHEAFMRQYIGNNGELSVMIDDIVNLPNNIKGILFEFTFDTDGNIVNIVRV